MRDKIWEAYDKLDTTLCLNVNNGTLNFDLDKYDKSDCKDVYEMCKCIDTIKDALEVLDILCKHLSVCKPIDADEGKESAFEVFDLDLWGVGKQKEEFEVVKQWLTSMEE